MPRSTIQSPRGLSLREIDLLRTSRLREIAELERQRGRLQTQLAKIDDGLAALRGNKGSKREPSRTNAVRRRLPKNKQPLHVVVASILSKSNTPMKLSDITKNVRKSGYKSAAKDFGKVVYQVIYKTPEIVHSKNGKGYVLKTR